jgi:hypothetical protein
MHQQPSCVCGRCAHMLFASAVARNMPDESTVTCSTRVAARSVLRSHAANDGRQLKPSPKRARTELHVCGRRTTNLYVLNGAARRFSDHRVAPRLSPTVTTVRPVRSIAASKPVPSNPMQAWCFRTAHEVFVGGLTLDTTMFASVSHENSCESSTERRRHDKGALCTNTACNKVGALLPFVQSNTRMYWSRYPTNSSPACL